ncbi:MAG: hypothetical protein LWY06_02575 [Firmicutes bacterium]|nr:hypothetical protein [Bacillota bacterium]
MAEDKTKGNSEAKLQLAETDSGTEKKRPVLKDWLPAVILSFILALIPAWSVLPRMKTSYLGAGELEGWLWRYWWFKQLMASLFAQNPKDWGFIIYTYLCAGNYPETGNVFDWQTLSLMLEPIFGDPVYYNVKIILILFLNGLAGFALAKYLTKNPAISLLGSAILILNPYVVYEIANGRPRQVMLFTLPLFAMYLIDNYRTLSLKSGLLAGFWLGMSAAVYLFYGMSALFFGAIFIIVQLFADHKKFTFTFGKYVVVMLLLFVMISAPFSYRYIELLMKKEKLPEVTYQRDFPPLGFLLQDQREVDQRDPLSQSIMRYRSDSPPALFPFYLAYVLNIPIIITLLALVPLLFRRPVPWLWVVVFAFFYILSLGPYLRNGLMYDNYVRILDGRPVPLLYTAFFKYVPFFARLFAPVRMMGMMYVAILALVVINFKSLMEWVAGRFKVPNISLVRKITVAFVLLVIASMAFQMTWAGQIPVVANEVVYPEIYKAIAADKNENTGVIEVPFRVGDFVHFYQVFHGKKLLWGWTYGSIPMGFPEGRAKFLSTAEPVQTNTFVGFLESMNKLQEKPDAFQPADLEKLRLSGYRYVILHERGCEEMDARRSDEIYEYFLKNLTEALGEPTVTGVEKHKPLAKMAGQPSFKLSRIAVFRIY